MIVELAPEALADLEDAAAYWAEQNPAFAERLTGEIYAAAASLARLPRRGRPGRIEGARELSVPSRPYVFIYSISKDRVRVLRVGHTSRDWP